MRAHGQLVSSSCIVMRSDLKKNEIGLSLRDLLSKTLIDFPSSKATAFIYLGKDLKGPLRLTKSHNQKQITSAQFL